MVENKEERNHKTTSFCYTENLESPKYLACSELTPVQPPNTLSLLQGNSIADNGDFKLTDPQILES